MSRSTTITLAALVFASLTLSGCGQGGSTAQNTAEPTVPAWVLASAPDGAQSVSEAKANAKEGEQIVLRGRIGGRKEPMTEGSSVFTMIDLAIPHCGEDPDDKCRSPWDYCCETPETITANSATIQVVQADGRAITESLAAAGFSALDEVVVIGTVAARPSADVLTVHATGVCRMDD